MKNIYLVAAALTLVAACGGNSPDVSDAVTPETEVSALDFSESREATGDRGTIVEACQKFETKKVCNCIVDTMDAELDDEQLKSVAAIMGGGTIIPDSIKSKLDADAANAFDKAMTAWNENCELN